MSDSPPHTLSVSPMDSYNQKLVSNVHPPDWINPEPAKLYNLVVIGGGTAGLVTAVGSASLGARVALIERHLLGGDCLNVGCVPSKCLIRSSRVVHDIRTGSEFGVATQDEPNVDFRAVMERLRRVRTRISQHDSADRFRELGVDIFMGGGRFTGPRSVEVKEKILNFKKAVIATGTHPIQPQIDGLTEAGFLTNETVFSLTERPARLAVVGGGPIGCELSQAFHRLGSQVTLIEISPQVLVREHPEAARILTQTFQREGIDVRLSTRLTKVSSETGKTLHLEKDGNTEILEVDEILVAVGRAPNLETLNLEAVGVEYQGEGIRVNDYLQTTNPDIYAAGDICMNWKFTHAADAAARLVIQNALFMGRKKLSGLTMPRCTYTDPEIAHVGISEEDAKAQGFEVETFVQPINEVDRGIIEGEKEAFIKVLVKKDTDKILGATIVARGAGDMIGEITLAIVAGVGLKTLSRVINPYPTKAEAIKKIGDAYIRTRLTPFLKTVLGFWFSWTRK